MIEEGLGSTRQHPSLLLLITVVDLDAPPTVDANLVCDTLAKKPASLRCPPPSDAPDTGINTEQMHCGITG